MPKVFNMLAVFPLQFSFSCHSVNIQFDPTENKKLDDNYYDYFHFWTDIRYLEKLLTL